jgi:hypothetical protein
VRIGTTAPAELRDDCKQINPEPSGFSEKHRWPNETKELP